MKRLELVLPPDAILIIVAIGMWAVSIPSPLLFDLSLLWRAIAGAVILIAGLTIVQFAGAAFRQANTSVDPKNPAKASSLVTTGVYRFSRNPIYLGMTVVLLGWGVFLMNLPSLILISVFIICINRLQIIPEERILTARFGQAYSTYQQKVRRWL